MAIVATVNNYSNEFCYKTRMRQLNLSTIKFYAFWQYSSIYCLLLTCIVGEKSHFPAETLNLHFPGKTGGWEPGGGMGHEGGSLALSVSLS